MLDYMLRSWRSFPHDMVSAEDTEDLAIQMMLRASDVWDTKSRCANRVIWKEEHPLDPGIGSLGGCFKDFFLDFLFWKNREIMGNPTWRELLKLIFDPIYHDKLNHPLPVFFAKQKLLEAWIHSWNLQPPNKHPASKSVPAQKIEPLQFGGLPPLNTNCKRPMKIDGWKRNLASSWSSVPLPRTISIPGMGHLLWSLDETRVCWWGTGLETWKSLQILGLKFLPMSFGGVIMKGKRDEIGTTLWLRKSSLGENLGERNQAKDSKLSFITTKRSCWHILLKIGVKMYRFLS